MRESEEAEDRPMMMRQQNDDNKDDTHRVRSKEHRQAASYADAAQVWKDVCERSQRHRLRRHCRRAAREEWT